MGGWQGMDFAHIVSDNKIKEAIKDGEFNNIPGMGKPLKEDDLSHVPENLRMGYRMMKNAGMIEDEGALKKEMMTIDDLISKCYDNEERVKLHQLKSEKQLRLDQITKKRNTFASPASSFYKNRVNKKLGW
jgi:hypothetical protein